MRFFLRSFRLAPERTTSSVMVDALGAPIEQSVRKLGTTDGRTYYVARWRDADNSTCLVVVMASDTFVQARSTRLPVTDAFDDILAALHDGDFVPAEGSKIVGGVVEVTPGC